MKYIIRDWAGNRIFKNMEFDTFEDAWQYIYENVDNSEFERTQNMDFDVWQELVVEEKPGSDLPN